MSLKGDGRLTLVLGGARSGKSRYAEALVCERPSPWLYLATAEAYDDEMRARIRVHQKRRQEGWVTVDAPLNLAREINRVGDGAGVLVDCLTLWLSNILLAGRDIDRECSDLLEALTAARKTATITVVSNEVGLGIVPDNALARSFRDAQGQLNQGIAAIADRVVFVAAGLPLVLKG